MDIHFDERICRICPNLQIGLIRAEVINSPTSDALWNKLQQEALHIKTTYRIEELSERPAIRATRQLYRALGKDPSRYRVSSDALCRRIIKGMQLYRINTLVDLINIVSFRSGYAIGGFDADHIVGDIVTLSVGEPGEIFHGIGRGLLNIEGLPVYRDSQGGIGSPTSDEERTKITEDTRRVQIQINGFAEEMPMTQCIDYTIGLLQRYAHADRIESRIIRP